MAACCISPASDMDKISICLAQPAQYHMADLLAEHSFPLPKGWRSMASAPSIARATVFQGIVAGKAFSVLAHIGTHLDTRMLRNHSNYTKGVATRSDVRK
ncbi:hypothetical protein HGRIS_006195 [Hohenbuehelia grisea]|uniref:Uncharacterized protein n=1 Tax=Hohenbuehelia grisea TaxID=104357 RepID=A0ABR3K0A4_9AGAR